MKELAIEFKKARIKSSLSQRLLAEKTGVMQCTISRYESGLQDITMETAIKMAKALKDGELTTKITEIITKKMEG